MLNYKLLRNMELAEYHKYFENKIVDQGLKFKLNPVDINKYYSRFDFFKNHLASKSIVHVGCVDHVNLIEKKIVKNQWVHGFIAKYSKRCLGFDINVKGIEFLKDKLKISDVYVHNVIEDEIFPEIRNSHWDYMLIGEVVEHIGNPVDFLSHIHTKYSENVESLIITVPNAFRWSNFINGFKTTEFINNDHRFWFSPFTILKVATDAGFQPRQLFLVSSFPKNRISWIYDWFFHRKPFYNDIIIAVLDFNTKHQGG